MPKPKESPLFTLDEVTLLRSRTRNLMDRVLFDIALDTAWPLWRIIGLDWENIRLEDELDWILGCTNETGKKLEPVTLHRSGSDLRVLRTFYKSVTHGALFFDNKGERLSDANAQKMFRQLGRDSELGGAVFRRLRRTAEVRKKELRVFTQCPRCKFSVNRDDWVCKRCGMLLNEKLANALLEHRENEKKKIDTFVYADAVARKYAEWIGEISGLIEAVQMHIKALPDPEDLKKMVEVIKSYEIVHQKKGFTKKQMNQSWAGGIVAMVKIAQAAPAHKLYNQAILDALINPNEQQFLELHKNFLDGLSWIKRHYGADFPVRPFLQ